MVYNPKPDFRYCFSMGGEYLGDDIRDINHREAVDYWLEQSQNTDFLPPANSQQDRYLRAIEQLKSYGLLDCRPLPQIDQIIDLP